MIRRARAQMREEGHIDLGWFFFHPHRYGIATLARIGFKLPSGHKVMLHHFSPHTETEFHDHPWGFRTLVLWGEYADESPCHCQAETSYGTLAEALAQHGFECAHCDGTGVVRDMLTRGARRRRGATHAHRTSCTGHVVTIVVADPKSRQWCKGTPERWVCGGEVQDFDATRGMVKVR